MKRSGNHAVLNWIISDGSFAFHNNVLPFARYRGRGGHLLRRHAGRFLWEEIRAGRFLASWRLVSVEDVAIREPVFLDQPPGSTNIILVRDPANLFASRIRKSATGHSAYARDIEGISQAVELWKEHAREALGLTSNLSNKVAIHFDRWVCEPGYRAALATRLGITPDETALHEMATHGGGSSFQAGVDGVLDRVSLLTRDEQSLLSLALDDPEVVEYRQRLNEMKA